MADVRNWITMKESERKLWSVIKEISNHPLNKPASGFSRLAVVQQLFNPRNCFVQFDTGFISSAINHTRVTWELLTCTTSQLIELLIKKAPSEVTKRYLSLELNLIKPRCNFSHQVIILAPATKKRFVISHCDWRQWNWFEFMSWATKKLKSQTNTQMINGESIEKRGKQFERTFSWNQTPRCCRDPSISGFSVVSRNLFSDANIVKLISLLTPFTVGEQQLGAAR